MTEPRYTVEFNGTAGGWFVHDAQKTHESFGQTFANQPIYADEICEQLNAKDAEIAALRIRVDKLEAALKGVVFALQQVDMGTIKCPCCGYIDNHSPKCAVVVSAKQAAALFVPAPSPQPAPGPATPQPSAYAQRQIERTAAQKADERSGKK